MLGFPRHCLNSAQGKGAESLRFPTQPASGRASVHLPVLGKFGLNGRHRTKGGRARFRTMAPLSKARKIQAPAMPKIARRPVVSSMMRSAGYDEVHAVLEIEFVTGQVYRYHAVPRREWRELMDAESKGRYFDAYIRDKYPMMRVQGA